MKKSGLFALLIVLISWASFGQNSDDNFKKEGKNSQSVSINQSFSGSSEIFPFGQNGEIIYGLDATATIELNGDNSLVRMILTDSNYNEYLIYESYNLLLDASTSFTIENICEETSILDGVSPRSIQIEIKNAQLQLQSISYSAGIDPGLSIENLKKEKKKGQNKVKINKINNNLKMKGQHWLAGETSVSELSFGDRKKLYGQSTFPAGFEYYSGGVITAGSTDSGTTTDGTLKSATTATESPYVDKWDWRDRHGKNWITPVTNQGTCGSCWAFAATGATEAMVNLFYNQQINLDLSEQDLLSCSGAGDCGGGYPSYALDYIATKGIVDEATFPYAQSELACSEKGSNPQETIKIGGRVNFGSTAYPKNEDVLKDMLIKMGPLSAGQRNWAHAMVLVGYRVVKEGDIFYYQNLDGYRSWEIVTAESSLIGRTVWIFKNSWGSYFGDSGYVYIESTMDNFDWTHAVLTPITSTVKNYNVICEDKDGDGYYWWGMGPKPATCTGPDEPDGDDSDATLGPLDDYGHCTVIGGQPVANFLADITSVVEGESVQFKDVSSNALAREWTFEGGTPATSTSSSPSVLYETPGIYDVTLTVYNKEKSDVKTVAGYIVVEKYIPDYCKSHGDASAQWIESVQLGSQIYTSGSSGTAGYQDLTNFTYNVDPGSVVTFTLTPGFSGRTYLEQWKIWIDYNGDLDFDDTGELVYTSSITSYPVSKTTTIPSNLNIKTGMRVSMKRNASASACEIFTEGEVEDYTIQIGTPTGNSPVANFSTNKTLVTTDETVSFTDLSTNTPTSWYWTFEGGTPATSTAQNPTVTYGSAGSYKVTLTATNADGSNTKAIDNYIEVTEPIVAPVANFSANPRSLVEGESVTFTDLSSNEPTSWEWIFEGGDPATSTAQNPTVTYYTANTYSVTLTVTNEAGSNTQVLDNYIEVSKPVILPIADFKANTTSVTTNQSVNFTDLSSNTNSWNWTFEGGNPATSSAQNPIISYSAAGTFKVTLTASNTDGSDTKTIDNYIVVTKPIILPIADFSANTTSVTTNESVIFTNLSSNGNSWSWTFEGGNPATSSAQNPSITYSTAGTYKVTLTASNTDGSDTKTIDNYIVVTEPVILPIADFSADKRSADVEETVNFTDLSSDADSWSWTFKGGNPATSTLQNPSVTYAAAGNYNVTLVAKNKDGSNTKTVDNYIQVNEAGVAPAANFTANMTSITQGETVAFSDLSANEPTSWNWTFEGGNPGTSTAQNPTITYSAAGTYKVTLVAANNFGSDTKTVDSYIQVTKPLVLPVADFSANKTSVTTDETVTFTDLTSNNPVSWNWTFEGGTPATSTQQNPMVTYSSAGTYNVTLTATNADGSDTKSVYNYIEVTKPVVAPLAEFSVENTSITEGETIIFSDLSSNEPTSWSWSFEGGTPGTSTQQNPSVTYTTPGVYSVTLVTSNAGGSDTKTIVGYIQVEEYISSYCIPTVNANEEWIAGVKIDEQSNTSGSNGYADFTSFGFDLESGSNQTITLTPGFSSRSKFEYWAVWIDFNQDMTFSDSEKVFSSAKSRSAITATIFIQAGINITTRMRVAMSPTAPSACNELTGEIEDYTVKIFEPAPVADFTANSTSVAVGETVQFTNTSLYNPTSLLWNFYGINPGTSTANNPIVTYNIPGEYIVTLTASNNAGTSQKSMNITVYAQNDNAIPDYCSPQDVSSTLNYIRRIVFAGSDIESGAESYQLSASKMDNITAGENYIAEFYPYSNATRNYWKVWIDYNNDGDFDDSNEMVLDISNKKGMVSGTISIPSDAAGTTRMRVVMKVGGAPVSPCETGFSGEAEDYTITINEALPQAATPPSPMGDVIQNQLKVYPNPTTDYVNIKIDEIGFNDIYSIYDIGGKLLAQGQISSSDTRVNLSTYPQGIYMIRIANNDRIHNMKIIKKD
ncbi:PKD domain-containing protein [Maribellus sp. YY47]|uniref:PKD domain-containing protein n=1 Tax=Maribellus sp. YY47 TaxID=2929486 RepID=UPI002001098E|nr:PKD domain-containing protein [Maribellus sp. YY47]MCK3682713.1 PKD domain-containing protein [Maribellus sp. YY47]